MSVTSKQPQPHVMRDWYPYYAGFPNRFVAWAIETHFRGAPSLLDPWNGSGTTTAVAASLGISSSGLEINPAATIIARARVTPASIRDSLHPIAEEICLATHRVRFDPRSEEPLANWLRQPAVDRLRKLQRAIHEVVAGDAVSELDLAHEPDEASNRLGLLAAFYYAALFATTRDLLTTFKASNPTWLKYPPSLRHRLNPRPEKIASLFLDRTTYLAERLVIAEEVSGAAERIRTGSILDLGGSAEYDACLTSPPYATRVDYVRDSLAELALLGLGDDQVLSLRQRMTGTPLVRGVTPSHSSLRSDSALRVVSDVESHPSHGSSTYYGPWIRNYLASLEESFRRLATSVTSSGTVGLVVQDSHYKDVHIDLQGIVIEMMGGLGRPLRERVDYKVSHSLARRNPAARKRGPNPPRESLLVFRTA